MQTPLAISATYNEHDIFPHMVLGLIRDGFHIHVLDNWSTDGTYDAVKQIAADRPDVVTLERFPQSGPERYYDLLAILRRKKEIALQYPGRWIVMQDSDEIRCRPWPSVSLHEGLRRVAAAGVEPECCSAVRPTEPCGFRPIKCVIGRSSHGPNKPAAHTDAPRQPTVCRAHSRHCTRSGRSTAQRSELGCRAR